MVDVIHEVGSGAGNDAVVSGAECGAVVHAGPDAGGEDGGVAHHPGIFCLAVAGVGCTGFSGGPDAGDHEALGVPAEDELAGLAVGEDVGDHVGGLRVDNLAAGGVFPAFDDGVVGGVGDFEDVGVGFINAVAGEGGVGVCVFDEEDAAAPTDSGGEADVRIVGTVMVVAEFAVDAEGFLEADDVGGFNGGAV